MAHKFVLIITKTELSLDGVNLDKKERMQHAINRMNKAANPNIVKHFTVLLQKEFTTGIKAWAYATNDLIDSLGVTYFENGSIGSDYCDYSIDVCRDDRIADYIHY